MAIKKIAVVTNDGERISSHLGMAHYYHVYHVDDGKVVHIEVREKPFHQSHDHSQDHEHGEHHRNGGRAMFEPIKDCQVLIAGGMGQPAFQHAQSYHLEIVMSGGKVRDAIDAYLHGELQSDMRRVHQH